jgi:hypothetical protein
VNISVNMEISMDNLHEYQDKSKTFEVCQFVYKNAGDNTAGLKNLIQFMFEDYELNYSYIRELVKNSAIYDTIKTYYEYILRKDGNSKFTNITDNYDESVATMLAELTAYQVDDYMGDCDISKLTEQLVKLWWLL